VLQPATGPDLGVPILDISRSGSTLRCDWKDGTGTLVQLVLPGTETAVVARLVRAADGVLEVAFRQDPATLALVDQVLRQIGGTARRTAA
jgi:hypothetical protein